jgi:hypothetical protein
VAPDRGQAELVGALDSGRLVLDRMPLPSNPRNQVVVDPAKSDFYALGCARRVVDDAVA